MEALKGQKIAIIGATSGMGLATAQLLSSLGAHIIVGSRSLSRSQSVCKTLVGSSTPLEVDLTNEQSIVEFFNDAGTLDHLIMPGSSIKVGPIKSLSSADALYTLTCKFFGPYLAAKYATLKQRGSIVLFSGTLSRRPSNNMTILSATNGAVESLGRSLALELSPVRVNVISPGLVKETAAYQNVGDDAKRAMFQNAMANLPAKYVGSPNDIAHAVLFLITNPYTTGTVLDIDGGGVISR